MIQRSLLDYYKSTKPSSSENTVKNKINASPKPRNRNNNRRILAQAREKPLQTTPVKDSSSPSPASTTPMKSSQVPKYVIVLDDSDDDILPDVPSPVPISPKFSSSSFSKDKSPSSPSEDTCSEPPSPRKFSQSSSQDPEKRSFCLKSQSQQSSQDRGPKSLPKNTPKSHIPSESVRPKRYLNFSGSQNSEKRRKCNEIMTELMTRENSFQGHPIASSTSQIESLEVSQILYREAQKELSFSSKSDSFMREEGMLSDDDCSGCTDKHLTAQYPKAVSPRPEKPDGKCIQVLSVAKINSKFDSHENSMKNSPNSHSEIPCHAETPRKHEKRSTNAENYGRTSLSQGPAVKKAENFLVNFTDILDHEEPDESLQAPIKLSTGLPGQLKTPEKMSKSSFKCFSTQDTSPSPATPTKAPSSTYTPLKKSPRKRRIHSPRKIFKENINYTTVVENLNLAKQGSIPMNEFDLEKIYDSGEYEFKWGKMDTRVAVMYEPNDVVLPMNLHSERLFDMIYWVFSEPMNCGYFNNDERDTVFNMMTLRKEAQVLLARMLKREIKWFRVRKQRYEDHIGGNQEEHFLELANRGFFDSNYENIDIEIVLNLLQIDELKQLCKMMKKSHTVAKPKMIASLKQMSREKSGLFGSKSPRDMLMNNLAAVAGPILKLSDKTLSLIHRILVLYYPNHDPEDGLSDVFLLFNDVHFGNRAFPTTPIMRLPFFRNRQALIDYVTAKLTWMKIIKIMNEKNKDNLQWELARDCGTRAYQGLKAFVQEALSSESGSGASRQKQTASTLPSHIGRFSAIYIWSKILISSIDAFKKMKADGYLVAKNYIEFLINNRDKIPVNCGKLYKELTMIEMSHLKDLERSAELTLEAFALVKSPIDEAEMLERARKLNARAKGISQVTKTRLKEILDELEEKFVCLPKIESIEVMKMEKDGGGKSVWQFDCGDEDKSYGSVEEVALNHYAKNGYPKGIHCEGSLPVTLFACLFWEEIYEIPVPGAFLSQFQREPLDLFGSDFYKNRRMIILRKIAFLENIEEVTVIADIMADAYSKYSCLESIIVRILGDAGLLREVVACLGKKGVLGICKKIIFEGYVNWRSGFPDLFVWNSRTSRCRVVEVKGPGDALSVKQKLWIKYLEEIHVPVEVCYVKARQKC